MAVFAVILSMAVVFSPMVVSEDSEATGIGEYYRYTMTTELVVTDVDGNDMTAISRISDWNIDVGSWGFDDAGYGPFNSYYAAINPSTGKVLCHLDPNNLAQSVDGETVVDGVAISDCNIMWVLPTVWVANSGNDLVITNDPMRAGVSGAQAYAHIIDGHIYNYLAIGVYEAYYNSSSGILMSKSGVSPTVNTTIVNSRDYANNNTVDGGHAMIWNWYHYEMYRLCSLAVMGSYDSQTAVGYGACEGSGISAATGLTSGQLDDAPYSGSEASDSRGVKLFIENAWGGVWDYLDDCYWNSGTLYAGQNTAGQSTGSSMHSCSGGVSVGYTSPGSGYGSGCSTNLSTWGMPTSYSSSWSTSAPDNITNGTNTSLPLPMVGGDWHNSTIAGLSCVSNYNGTNSSNHGFRLAMVFDVDPVMPKTVVYDHGALLGSGGTATQVANLPTEQVIADGAVYPDFGIVGDFVHIGWYVNGGFIEPGAVITETSDHTAYSAWQGTTITITFDVEGNTYTTLQVPKGSVGIVFTPDESAVTGVFMGWYLDSAYTEKYDATVALTSDITLYAKGVMPLEFTSVPTAVATITNVNPSGLVYFDATDSEGRLNVFWDFGDGQTSTDVIAYNEYEEPGTYTVTLTVTNAYGQTAVQSYSVTAGEVQDNKVDNIAYIVLSIGAMMVGLLLVRRVL